MITICQQKVGETILARLVARPRHRRSSPSFYIVSSYVDYPDLVAIGLCPTCNIEKAVKIFYSNCADSEAKGYGQ
jgi:hypothetical protein